MREGLTDWVGELVAVGRHVGVLDAEPDSEAVADADVLDWVPVGVGVAGEHDRVAVQVNDGVPVPVLVAVNAEADGVESVQE